MLISVNYHYVRPTFDFPFDGIKGITPEQLRDQLTLLSTVGTFVSQEDILAALEGSRTLPARSLLVTFDDGLREQFDHALPILRELGISALFFFNTGPITTRRMTPTHKIHLLRSHLPTERLLDELKQVALRLGLSIEQTALDRSRALEHYRYDPPEAALLKYLLNFGLGHFEQGAIVQSCFDELLDCDEPALCEQFYMSRDQIRQLSEQHFIGSHGHDHLPLAKLTYEEIVHQIDTSSTLLSQWTGTHLSAFSYPFGSKEACSPMVARTVAESGLRFAFTMERAGNADLHSPMLLARCSCSDLPAGNAARWALDRLFEEIPQSSWYRGA